MRCATLCGVFAVAGSERLFVCCLMRHGFYFLFGGIVLNNLLYFSWLFAMLVYVLNDFVDG